MWFGGRGRNLTAAQVVGAWLAMALSAGCSSQEREASVERAEERSSRGEERFEGTAGIVSVPRPEAKPAVLRDVRLGDHEGFQRVVFDFGEDPVPGYHLEYVDKPVRQCGSGHVVEVAGDGWLRVRFTPADAHTPEGEPTVVERDRRFATGNVRQLVLLCDFEAQVEWVVGVGSPNRYRVIELSSPNRLVVDVRTDRKK